MCYCFFFYVSFLYRSMLIALLFRFFFAFQMVLSMYEFNRCERNYCLLFIFNLLFFFYSPDFCVAIAPNKRIMRFCCLFFHLLLLLKLSFAFKCIDKNNNKSTQRIHIYKVQMKHMLTKMHKILCNDCANVVLLNVFSFISFLLCIHFD